MAVLLLGITFLFVWSGILLPWGIHCAPALAVIMITGAKLGEDNRLFTAGSGTVWVVVNSIVCLVIVDLIEIRYPAAGILGAGLLGEVAGGIEVLFVLCFAVFGSYFMVNFGKLLEKVPVISKGLIWCGQHSLLILCLHRPIAYVIRDLMGLPHFITGQYTDRITMENLIAFLLIFVVMVPVIMIWDRLKENRTAKQLQKG